MTPTIEKFDSKTQERVAFAIVEESTDVYSPLVTLPEAQVTELTSVGPKLITPNADITQLITVATAGTPVQGPAKTNPGGWMLTADPANLGYVYWMFHGQTKATKGYPMQSMQQFPLMVSDLSQIDFDASANGLKIWAAKI